MIARLKKENHELQRDRDEIQFRYDQVLIYLSASVRVAHCLWMYVGIPGAGGLEADQLRTRQVQGDV